MTDLMERTEAEVKQERKRFDAIWWAGALIWIGLALGAENVGLLPRIDGEWWPWIFVGLGPWALILNVYQAANASLPNPTTWDWVWTVVFLGVAVGAFIDFSAALVGAAVLIIIGFVFLYRAVTNRE